MIKSDDMNVTIETASMLETFIETTLMLHAVRDVLVEEYGEEKADKLLVLIGKLAVLDDDSLCEVLAETLSLSKGHKHDS